MAMSLNHFSIRSLDLDACERFYCGLLGLTKGPRPPFPFPGLWLYAGDTAVWANAAVHIIGIDRNDPEGLKAYLGDRDEAAQLVKLHGKCAFRYRAAAWIRSNLLRCVIELAPV